MAHRLPTAFVCLLLAPPLLASAPHQVTAGQVSTRCVEEKQTAPFLFRDKKGEEHRVVFDFSARNKDGESTKRMKVEHSVKSNATREWTQVWETADAVEACPEDAALHLVAGSVTVTDADADGELEVAYAYVASCISDVSPLNMNLLLFEGKTQYALRGHTKIVDANHGTSGGRYKVDPAFEKAPKLLEAAKALWTKVVPVARLP